MGALAAPNLKEESGFIENANRLGDAFLSIRLR